MKPLPPIIIDTREQLPYAFDGWSSQRATLETGDYSILGYGEIVAVERKSKEDAWGCVGQSRARFRDCLGRLSRLASPAIVIEANLDDFAKPPPYTRLTSEQAVNTWISWAQEFRGIQFFWCPSRAYAERVTLRWLEAWWRHHNREQMAMQDSPPQMAQSVRPVLR